MKFNFKYLIMTILMLSVSAVALAMGQEVPEVDLSNTSILMGIATPFLTLAGVWVAKKFVPILKGTGTLLIAMPLMAGLITWLTSYIAGNDLSWILQLLLGSGSIFIHQLYYYMSGQASEDKEIIEANKNK